ncbi:hypothetical protein DERP_003473 [Dermatophagoides pteronyssinus]|uniref:Uncharacterized protein n=1 Tax=Dermatophagoides pteronyssinus TaxID=6956 RepID=A0ABQ8JKR4_DERPT|nr:hypothetical protein DERP_003473 [Dermatophagoides pteronyssinus]
MLDDKTGKEFAYLLKRESRFTLLFHGESDSSSSQTKQNEFIERNMKFLKNNNNNKMNNNNKRQQQQQQR